MNKLAIIDADGLAYQSSKETLEESINILDEKIQNIFTKTEATHYVMFISKGKYFRHNIDPEYKSNRKKYPTQLKWIKSLKSYLEEKWNAQWMEGVEADDLCAYWFNKNLTVFNIGLDSETIDFSEKCKLPLDNEFKPLIPILCSPDKDLLQSIPGKHWNYTYKLTNEAKKESKTNPEYVIKDEDIIKGWWVETKDEEANYFKLKQLIVGDSVDNIKTPFPESAGDWFVKNKMNFNDIVSAYILGFNYETPTGIKKYVKGLGTAWGLHQLNVNYKLLHLLENDSDFIREVNQTPEFPKINKINYEPIEESKQIDF